MDMASLEQVLIPVVLSAVLVFVASSLIHMVFKYHNAEYRGFGNEEDVRRALKGNAPGQYFVPYCPDFKDMKKPEVQQKFIDGPTGMVTLRAPGPPTMGAALGGWFVMNLVVAILAGYLAWKTLPVGISFLAVARVVSIVTFVAYAGGAAANAIWMGKPWSAALKEMFDAFIYGLVTACVFGWLWPR